MLIDLLSRHGCCEGSAQFLMLLSLFGSQPSQPQGKWHLWFSTGVIQLATIVQLIMEMLWQSTLPQMHVLHEKGMQLSPIWLSDTM